MVAGGTGTRTGGFPAGDLEVGELPGNPGYLATDRNERSIWVSTDFLIKDEMEWDTAGIDTYSTLDHSEYENLPLRRVSLEEANAYTAAKTRVSSWIALGVAIIVRVSTIHGAFACLLEEDEYSGQALHRANCRDLLVGNSRDLPCGESHRGFVGSQLDRMGCGGPALRCGGDRREDDAPPLNRRSPQARRNTGKASQHQQKVGGTPGFHPLSKNSA